jgi:hypothetical protein
LSQRCGGGAATIDARAAARERLKSPSCMRKEDAGLWGRRRGGEPVEVDEWFAVVHCLLEDGKLVAERPAERVG